MKKGAWVVQDKLYHSWMIILCCTEDELPARVKKLNIKQSVESQIIVDFSGLQPTGGRYSYKDGISVVWISPKASISAIAHEAAHVTIQLFRDRGLRLDRASEEAYTYHTGWVFGEIYSRLVGKL